MSQKIGLERRGLGCRLLLDGLYALREQRAPVFFAEMLERGGADEADLHTRGHLRDEDTFR